MGMLKKDQNKNPTEKFNKWLNSKNNNINKKFLSKFYPRVEAYQQLKKNFNNINEMFFRSIGLKVSSFVDIILSRSRVVKKVKTTTVCRQTRSGRQFRKKVCIAIGDLNGSLGVGIKSSLNIYDAVESATNKAKLNYTRIKRGFWENPIGSPHTVASKSSGKSGSVIINIFPAPKGIGIKAARFQYEIISVSGISDCYTKSYGSTQSSFNTIKATFK